MITIKTEYGIKLCTHGANATKRKLNCNRRTASMAWYTAVNASACVYSCRYCIEQ